MSDVQKPLRKCGIIMPIGETDQYTVGHWAEVLEIIKQAAGQVNLEASLVSISEGSAIIHKTIVENVFNNDIVVCDVSSKNPNVMLEMGLRLTSEKPIVVIKDDVTGYSFDSSPIEHLGYPKSLRYADINAFKDRLAEKLSATLKMYDNGNYVSFLKAFGEFKVLGIEETAVPSQEFIIDKLSSLERMVTRALQERIPEVRSNMMNSQNKKRVICRFPSIAADELEVVLDIIRNSIPNCGVKTTKGLNGDGRVEFFGLMDDAQIGNIMGELKTFSQTMGIEQPSFRISDS